MKDRYDIVVIGAGPAGMAAATAAAGQGASVLVADEQPAAGGQIYRGLSHPCAPGLEGEDPERTRGRDLIAAFAASGAEHAPGTTVWQVAASGEIGVSQGASARLLNARQVIIASGAQERPFPIPGWTLPGVLGAGAAQILLKASNLTLPDAVLAGTGPLLYLLAHQYLQHGTPPRAILDVRTPGNSLRAALLLPGALLSPRDLRRGRRWLADLRSAQVRMIHRAEALTVLGKSSATGLAWRRHGRWQRIDSANVLLHLGVVPNVNLALAAGCAHRWNPRQACWQALTDPWGESSVPGIAIAGDGAGIQGARAAEYLGRIAAIGAAWRCGLLSAPERDRLAAPQRRALARERRPRAFLEALFHPPRQFRIPADGATIVCRCEEVTAARIRAACARGCTDPNQLKGLTRCAMGPCQGRYCALTISEMIAGENNQPVASMPLPRLRPPIKPLPLTALTSLAPEAETRAQTD